MEKTAASRHHLLSSTDQRSIVTTPGIQVHCMHMQPQRGLHIRTQPSQATPSRKLSLRRLAMSVDLRTFLFQEPSGCHLGKNKTAITVPTMPATSQPNTTARFCIIKPWANYPLLVLSHMRNPHKPIPRPWTHTFTSHDVRTYRADILGVGYISTQPS
jgi:hypothetical protein